MDLRTSKNRLINLLLNRYTLFICALLLYMAALAKAGGPGIKSGLLRLELPLLLALYWYCNRLLRPGKLQPFLAGIPAFLIYAVHDAYFHVYGQLFRLINLYDTGILMQALPPLHLTIFIAVFILPLMVFLVRIDWRRRFISIGAGILLLGCAIMFPRSVSGLLNTLHALDADWDDFINAGSSGRLSVMLGREALRRVAIAELKKYDSEAGSADVERTVALLKENGNRHSVHLVMLESLLDPTLFKALGLSRDPYHPAFRKFFGTTAGFSVAPIFGGGTSESTFEMLCGAPGYKRFSSTEFNAFTGAPAYCLPGLLQKAGYRTVISHPFAPQWDNGLRAYPGLGFAEMYFPAKYFQGRTFISLKNVSPIEGLLFDGDFFRQTLDFLKTGEDKRPVFDFMVGIYGHFPISLDAKLRPPLIAMDRGSQQLVRVVNQFYYRTEALAELVNRINKEDPRSLIIMVGDHLPPLELGMTGYEQLEYMQGSPDPLHTTRIFIAQDGKPVKYRLLHHYDVPAIILDYLTDGAYCREKPCSHKGYPPDNNDLMTRYMRVMARGTK